MSTQDCELLILNELKSTKSELKFGSLLKSLQKYSKESRIELTTTLVAVIIRLIYRGKISMPQGLSIDRLTESAFKIV